MNGFSDPVVQILRYCLHCADKVPLFVCEIVSDASVDRSWAVHNVVDVSTGADMCRLDTCPVWVVCAGIVGHWSTLDHGHVHEKY